MNYSIKNKLNNKYELYLTITLLIIIASRVQLHQSPTCTRSNINLIEHVIYQLYSLVFSHFSSSSDFIVRPETSVHNDCVAFRMSYFILN
jgi:hypothetical protein